MEFIYDDGGRAKYFKTSGVRDCVTRAIAIATGKDYKEVYDELNELAKKERKAKTAKSNSRNGVRKTTTRKYLAALGWEFVPTMSIGSGCKVHMRADELPKGTIIVSMSKHVACVKDGVLYDTYDSTRDGERCVYGYYIKRTHDN